MLTSIGRAAARRVVASSNAHLAASSTAALAKPFAFTLRPVAVRSFTVSIWVRQAAKTGSTTTKKPAAKKSTATKKATKKTAPKKKKAAKPKKPVVKKKKKVAKPQLTPEQKDRARYRQLRKLALLAEDTPKNSAGSGWNVFINENLGNRSPGTPISETVSSLSSQYKNLSSFEKERLESKAKSNKQKFAEDREAWVRSHPATDVYIANAARKSLTRLAKKLGIKKRFPQIPDDRQPKRPQRPFLLYLQSRKAALSGSQVEMVVQAGKEWHNLSEAEKRPFTQEFEQQKQRLDEENKGFMERVAERKAVLESSL